MPFIEQDQAVALSSQPDIRFFRNTGLALVTATLMAGAITLSLTLKSGSVTLARNAEGAGKTTTQEDTGYFRTSELFHQLSNYWREL
jgi:hypothetical protein